MDLMYQHQLAEELSSFLHGNKLREGLYNIRCPVCGDSKKDKTKKRFYIYEKNNKYKCVCHNCRNENDITNGSSLEYFVRNQYPMMYERYKDFTVVEKQFTSVTIQSIAHKVSPHQIKSRIEPSYPESLLNGIVRLDLVFKHNQNHPIVQYILKRKISIESFKRLYVTNGFKESVLEVAESQVEKMWNNTPALVLPSFNADMTIQTIQGRFLSDKFRFLTVRLTDSIKTFGLERLDNTKPCFIVEAPIDSLHLSNSVASMDAALSKSLDYVRHPIFCFDNQPRNKDVVAGMRSIIDANHKLVIFDKNVDGKDLNDFVRNGMSETTLEQYLHNHTFSGDFALDKWYEWKKI
jgi:hypothetical protein